MRASFWLTFCCLALTGCGGTRSADPKSAGKKEPVEVSPATSAAVETPAPLPVATSERIGAGTVIPFALDELIDAETSPAGAMFSGKVAADVMGTDGKLAVPQGSAGVVLVGEAWKKEGTSVLSVLLYQLTVNGHSYLLGRSQGQMPRLDYRDEAAKGTAHRTVHLERDQILKFSLKEPLRFNP